MTYFRLLSILWFIIICNPTLLIAQKTTQNIYGNVLDLENKEGVPFAKIKINNNDELFITDANGFFSIPVELKDKIVLEVESLGYETSFFNFTTEDNLSKLKLHIPLISFKLDEVIISPQYKTNKTSEVKVNQTTLEYIQPTSVRDIFSLLPGGYTSPPSLQQATLYSSRQSGSDANTSFGLGVVIDGTPINNDGYRTQLGGFTGEISDLFKASTINTGVDLRTLSTDHIESITIVKGISSAREGNLSSGVMKITSKKGRSPLRIRAKLDPLNKIVYAGKGFVLSPKLGTLHSGIDLIESKSDLRDELSSYTRMTSQLNYNNQFHIGDKVIDLGIKGSNIFSLNKFKEDEISKIQGEEFEHDFQRYMLSTNIDIRLNYPIIDKIKLFSSVDYTKDLIKHKKFVYNSTALTLQKMLVEGENEGEYLPSMYYSNYSIDNKPINTFSGIDFSKFFTIGNNLTLNLLYGASFNTVKNIGQGAITDSSRPPFPSAEFIRPRPNKDIPTYMHGAIYFESEFKHYNNNNEFLLSLGLRETKMFNLPKDFKLRKELLVEPRTQIAWTNKIELKKYTLNNTIRLGYGIENKLPSIDYLYPDKIYQDFIILNAYFNDPDKRYLITNTKIHNPQNSDIRENKNVKMEIGWDIEYNKYLLSVSAFKEELRGGIEYFTEYKPISYNYYYELKTDPDLIIGKPTKDDYKVKIVEDFTSFRKPVNSAKIIKKGIEYRIAIPKIKSIYSEIEINGAYYKTLYTNGVPVMHRPSEIIKGETFKYVGFYDGFEKTYSERLNTNIWINTHIPEFKMIFTTSVQTLLYRSTYRGNDISLYPSKYMDVKGNIYNISKEELEQRPELMSLKNLYIEHRYAKNKRPFSVNINIKVTKEINKKCKISFFANNILSINPKYETVHRKTSRNWSSAFFGSELILNL